MLKKILLLALLGALAVVASAQRYIVDPVQRVVVVSSTETTVDISGGRSAVDDIYIEDCRRAINRYSDDAGRLADALAAANNHRLAALREGYTRQRSWSYEEFEAIHPGCLEVIDTSGCRDQIFIEFLGAEILYGALNPRIHYDFFGRHRLDEFGHGYGSRRGREPFRVFRQPGGYGSLRSTRDIPVERHWETSRRSSRNDTRPSRVDTTTRTPADHRRRG